MSRAHKMTWLVRSALAVLTVTIAILVFGPFGGLEQKVGFTDKEAHVLAFYALTTLSLLALPKIRKWDVALICLAIGGLIEVVQAMVGRDGNIPDWLADAFGISLVMAPLVMQSMRRSMQGNRPARRRTDRAGAHADALTQKS
ncbi:MAG: VanZ family protein [Asticcacaulis sp.]|uniref:VanZ family protein n=1 Tax=Asticcacaulis sp. TaxID=1872648 RepID=UPI0039E2A6E0